jgi:hypothetical protein
MPQNRAARSFFQAVITLSFPLRFSSIVPKEGRLRKG